MKTLALVACFLAISYAANPKVTEMYNNLASCTKEFNVQGWTAEVIKCMLEKDKIIDEQGLINKEKLSAHFDTLISDAAKLKKAKDMAAVCFQQAQSGSNDEMTMTAIRCSVPIAELFDKPE